jgi:hypothetical protein
VHTPQNQNTKQQQKKESLAQSQKKKLVTERTGMIPQHTIVLVREEEKTLHKTAPFLNSLNPNGFFLSTKTDHTPTKAPELEPAVVVVVVALLLITVNTKDLQQKQGLRKKLEKPKKKQKLQEEQYKARRRKKKKKKLLLLLTCF